MNDVGLEYESAKSGRVASLGSTIRPSVVDRSGSSAGGGRLSARPVLGVPKTSWVVPSRLRTLGSCALEGCVDSVRVSWGRYEPDEATCGDPFCSVPELSSSATRPVRIPGGRSTRPEPEEGSFRVHE